MSPLMLELLAGGCFTGFLVLLVVTYMQSTAPVQVDLREKLKNLTQDPEAMAKEIDLGLEKKSLMSGIDFKKIFSQFTGKDYMDNLEKQLTQCDIPVKPGEFLFIRILFIFMSFLLSYIVWKSFLVALAVGGLMSIIHIPVLAFKRAARVDKFVLQLAEFLILITNSLRSGQTFLQGVDIASRESPNPIGMEFRLLLKETNLGIPVETSFANMLLRVPSEDLKIVMSAFSIQRNVGGNLADIMDKVAAMIRERIKIQGQIKVLTTQGKLSGGIVGLLPFGLGTVISLLNYDYMSKLWTARSEPGLDPFSKYLGPILLAAGLFFQLVGCFVIYKICDIEV